ncbi:MAG TPA: hypothetical protein VHO00_12955 [Actinomycetes bacterium]|jgi:hypothetical protein|nr:hypothetical protein [Actinomycetes bacterium]
MPVRLVGWVAVALAVAVVLELVVPPLVFLTVPIAVVARILVARYGKGHQVRDVAEMLLSGAAALPGDRTSSNGAQVDWGAALYAELASISDPRERRRFALGATVAMLGTPRRLRSGLLAAGMAVAFAAVLLGFSRATVGHDGLGSVSVLLPPVMLFAIGFLCAWSTRSLQFGVETGVLAAVTILVAVAVVFGIEAAHWYDVAHVSVFDGEYVDFGTSRAAVLDAMHPVILLVHLLFWLPWPVLGAVAGVRARRRGDPSAAANLQSMA